MSNDSSSEQDTAQQPHREKRKLSAGSSIASLITTSVTGLVLYLVPPFLASIALILFFTIIGVSAVQLESYLTEGALGQFWFVLTTEILVLGLLILFMRQTRETWKSIGVKIKGQKVIGSVVLGFFVYFAAFLLVYQVASNILPIDFDQEQELGFDTGTTGLALVAVFISLVVLPPIVEEVVFRGYIYTRFKRVASVGLSAFLVSILFGVAHLQLGSGNPPLWIAAIDTFILSLVLVWLRERTGSIWACVGLHAMKNGLAFFVLFMPTPSWLL